MGVEPGIAQALCCLRFARLLTDGKSRNDAPLWSNAGREVAFTSTARDGRSFDIDIAEPESGALPRLAVASGHDPMPLILAQMRQYAIE